MDMGLGADDSNVDDISKMLADIMNGSSGYENEKHRIEVVMKIKNQQENMSYVELDRLVGGLYLERGEKKKAERPSSAEQDEWQQVKTRTTERKNTRTVCETSSMTTTHFLTKHEMKSMKEKYNNMMKALLPFQENSYLADKKCKSGNCRIRVTMN